MHGAVGKWDLLSFSDEEGINLPVPNDVIQKAMKPEEVLEEGRRVLRVEADALNNAAQFLGPSFVSAVELMRDRLQKGGKVVTCGVGKSGNVAQKVTATLTSTGSASVFLHPTEALHGDLGIVAPNDVLLLFSHSGSTQEILLMLPAARNLCAGVVGIFGNTGGSLSPHCDAVIHAAISAEACPDNLAPTASSTVAMAIGDAIAMALKARAGFGPDHFARFHPGGKLGRRLLTLVEDLMHKEGDFACVSPDASMDDVVIALTKFRHSGVCITEGTTPSGKPRLAGVVVEGDIRRALLKKEAFFQLKARDIMTAKPKAVGPKTNAAEALDLMENSFLHVLDDEGGCVGVLRVHDLVLSGLN
jgi:arabinose-5-phosphate isomerase